MAAHRYWRIRMTAGAGGAYAFSEIQFRITAGSSLAFSGGTPSAADVFGGTPGANDASKAADGTTVTLYSSNNKTAPQWWAYDFGATSGNWRDVVEIAITARADSNANQAPSNFVPEWSDDNSAWTGFTPVTAAAWTTLGQVQVFAVVVFSLSPTRWNQFDASAGTTLSGGNLTAALAATSGTRATQPENTGKFYFEVTATAWGGATAVGLANPSANIALLGLGGAGGIYILDSGAAYSDGNTTSVNLGIRSAGNVVCIAIDLTTRLAWFRIGAAGNWNSQTNSGFSPGGTGGISFTSALGGGGGTSLFPVVSSYSGGANFTGNFGDSAFVGVVPAGFASGWPGAALVGGTQVRAMVLA